MNAKTEPHPDLVSEFIRKCGGQPEEAIAWAWDRWRELSPHLPAISDIHALLTIWRRNRWEQEEAERRAEDRRQMEEARARGELVDYPELVHEIKALVKRMPEPEHAQRLRNMRQVEMNFSSPPMFLTKEQIAERRAAEQEELRRYEPL